MKINILNKYFLIILIFIIAVSCYSVVVFAKIDEDIVDMDELDKFTTSQNTTTQEDKTVTPGSRGDVSGDGYINVQDLVLLKRHLAGYKNITVVEKACDISRDGEIDVRDAVLLSKHLAGIDVDLDSTEEVTKDTAIATPTEPTFPSVATPTEPTFPSVATPIEPTLPSVATPVEPTASQPTTTVPQPTTSIQKPTSENATTPESTTNQQISTTHPDPDGPGWSDWIIP